MSSSCLHTSISRDPYGTDTWQCDNPHCRTPFIPAPEHYNNETARAALLNLAREMKTRFPNGPVSTFGEGWLDAIRYIEEEAG